MIEFCLLDDDLDSSQDNSSKVLLDAHTSVAKAKPNDTLLLI